MSSRAELHIRPMCEADIATVLPIEQASFPLPWTHAHFLHETGARYSFPLVAESGGELVGYVCLTVLFEEAQILDIAVAPSCRNRGVARVLMQHAVELAVEKGAELLSLEVRSTNVPAITLYEKLGFRRCGVRARYYEGVDDAVLMEKILQGESPCSSLP